MKISVALASCNGETWIQEQLESILTQSCRVDEICISDDASDDRTVEIIASAARDSVVPILLEEQPQRLGHTRNFSRVLARSTGDIVFLADQDDIWQPDKVERVLRVMEQRSDIGVFLHDAELADEKGRGTGLTKLGQIRAAGMPESAFFMGSCMAVRASFLRAVLPIPDGYAEHDRWLAEIARAMGMLYVFEEPLQSYRRHGANQSRHPANRTTSLGRLGWLRHRIRRSMRADFVDRLQQQSANCQALLRWSRTAEAESLARGAPQRLSAMQTQLGQRLSTLRARRERLKLPRFNRWPRVIKAWHHGDYQRHSGIASALRDLLK